MKIYVISKRNIVTLKGGKQCPQTIIYCFTLMFLNVILYYTEFMQSSLKRLCTDYNYSSELDHFSLSRTKEIIKKYKIDYLYIIN